MNKKLIIMIAGAGLASFTGAFVFAWLRPKAPPPISQQDTQQTLVSQQPELLLPQQTIGTISAIGANDKTLQREMAEKQLNELLNAVREKMQEYNSKLQSLQEQEQRLQVAQDMLKKDIEELNNLRTELASVVAGLKSERDKLQKSRVEIIQTEKINLISIAATYDRMDAASAGKILTNMCKSQVPKDGVAGYTSGMDDAVKILHYMSERTKGKLLAELVTTEPKLAAVLCQKLKQVVEEQ